MAWCLVKHRDNFTFTFTFCAVERLTPWSRIMLQKLMVAQLVKKFPAFRETWSFITVFTTACHWSLSWDTWIHSIASHTICVRYVLILPSHLRLGFPSCLFRFPDQNVICIYRLITIARKQTLPLCLIKHYAFKTYGGTAPGILNFGTMWRWLVSFLPRSLYPRGKCPQYPFKRRIGDPQSRLERGREHFLFLLSDSNPGLPHHSLCFTD
jgi:hypothetical protein